MAEETDAPAPVPAKGKKKWLLIIIALVVVLAIAAAGVLWFLAKQRSAALDDEGDESAAQIEESKTPPTFLPMDNMVVNLADPGGDRFAQVGITLELSDSKTAERVKTLMPTIRSSVLLLLSQHTAEELLSREGKERLATDVRAEVLGALGHAPSESKPSRRRSASDGDDENVKPRKPAVDRSAPVRAVLFSSFIVQ